jgi:hypothetical protein
MPPNKKGRSKDSYGRKSPTKEEFGGAGDRNERAEFIKLNFKYLDESKFDSLRDWQIIIVDVSCGKTLLELFLEKWKDWGAETFNAMGNTKTYHTYSGYPSARASVPEPTNTPDRVTWCRFRIKEKVMVVGFREENTFFVVYLDSHHRWYPLSR